MTTPVNQWKLGLFVLVVLGAAVTALVGIGECSTRHATVAFLTYFDESVGGLDRGSRVEFRGVDVGSVSDIEIGPDHRHIEVTYDLDADALARMGIVPPVPREGPRYVVPAGLRAQIGGNGITGVRYVALDVVDPRQNPPPVLPFPVPPDHIPAAPSSLKSLEDSLARAADRIPALLDAIVATTDRVDRLLAGLQREDLSGRAATMLAHAERVLSSVDATIGRFDRERVPEKAARALDDARGAVGKVDRVLERLDGEQGLLASMGRATDAVGQVGRRVSSSTRDLDQALDELRDAAQAIRSLAEDIDRDPDMLLKGRPGGRAQ